MWTALRADRTGRSGRREPIVAVASWAGLDLFRPIAALYAAQLAYRRHAEMVRPWLAAVIIGVLLLWSLAMLLYRKRTAVTIVLETIIAGRAIIASMFVDTPANIADGVPTLPSMWPAGTVLGAAVLLGVRGGLLTAVIIGVADLIHVGFAPTSNTLHNIVLLLLLGGLFGLAVDLARDGQQRLEAVLAEQERLRERERLSRAVHDGVLQALAFIHRRGTEIGGECRAADLAAEQERSCGTGLALMSRPMIKGRRLRIGLAELGGPTSLSSRPPLPSSSHHTGERSRRRARC